MTLLNNRAGQLIPLFYTQSTINVTLDEPDPGDTVITAEFDVEWSFSGTQVSYVVQIFADADADELVYSSGIVVSASKEHTVPVGALENLTNYWVIVSVVASDGTAGETDLVQFSTSFAPSVGVSGVHAVAHDICSDAYDAPLIQISWSQVVPGGGEDFVEYRVLRRLPGETLWETLAVIDSISTVTYRDRFPQSHTGYEYAVLWVAQAGSDTLISTPQVPLATAVARFDYTWVQPVSNPNNVLRVDAWDSEAEVIQDVAVSSTAGRAKPTAFVGESLYHVVRIPTSPQIAKDSRWKTFLGYLESQAEGETFCLRIGKQRQKFFGTFTGQRRSNQQQTYGIGFMFTETHYSEDVED